LPTELTNDPEGKILRVRLIQKETGDYQPVYLFDQGSTVSWIPCGTKLTCSYPGIKLGSGPDRWFDNAVNVVEMDGQFDKLEELAYVEKHLGNTASKYDGEITAQMLKNKGAPGTLNGSGLFQTIVSLKIREVYEKLSGKKVDASVKAPVAA
jgi:phosphoribulokinase